MLRRLFALSLVFSPMLTWHLGAAPEWQKELQQTLPVLGHRNWIVIVDSAYPMQNTSGIKLVATSSDHLTLVREVLAAVQSAKHIRPHIYLDAELPFVEERYAVGIEKFRAELISSFGTAPIVQIPHEQLLKRLEEAGRSFEVLVLKSTLTLPYTSVFIELECGYWSDDAERALRAAIAKSRPATAH